MTAEIDSGNANIHESSDAEGVAGQIQGPALNIGADGAGGEHYLGRHARDLRRQAQGAGHLGGQGSDDTDAAAGHLDVQRGGRLVQHPDGSVRRGAQVRDDAGRSACRPRIRDHGSRRYRPPLHLTAVRLCQRSPRTALKC